MQRILKNLSAITVLLLWVNIGVEFVNAQASATVSGLVTDTSGAVLPTAAIQAKNVGTGISLSTLADEQGRFRFPDLPIGEYEMQAALPGFQVLVRSGIVLTVGSSPVVDFSLKVGEVTETVNVEGDVSQVETSSSAISNLVGQTEMRELPLNGRNFTQLMGLAPGVTLFTGGSNGSLFGSQPTYSVSGSRAVGMLFLLDNTNTAGYWNKGGGSGSLGTALGVDAIDQFQTLTNTYSAQYGGEGAIINASTKSGTNAFHGSAYEFLRNSAIEARNFFDGSRVPPYRQNQFGGTLGGPIHKDKAFFFVNYEGFRASRTVSNVAIVPDAMAHQFMVPDANGNYVPVGENPNPITAAAVRAALKLYPIATTEILQNGHPTGTGFITMPNNTLSYENYLIGRVDYTISPKDSLFVRYVLDRSSKLLDSPLLTDPELDLTRNNYVTIEERRVVSPTLLNLTYFSFVRNNESGDAPKRNDALQWFPGQGRVDGTVSPGSGITNVGINASTLPFYLIPNKFGVGDDIVWTHGAHGVTTGAKMERLQENTYGPAGVGGTWSFPNLTSFLQGVPTQFKGQLSDTQYVSDAHKDWRERAYAMYFQDDWQAAKRLTLNLGLRYEPTANSSWARHVAMNIVNAPYGNWEVVKNVHQTNISLKNLQPRIGLAWDVFGNHKTSLRAGFGMFNDLIFASETTMYLQPPFLSGTQTLAQGAVFPLPLTNIPPGSGTIVQNGTVSCSPCTYYKQTRTPTTYQYNFNIQREIAGSSTLTLAVVASHSNFLQVSHDWNYPVPFIGADGHPVFGQLINGNIVSNPRLNPTWLNLNMLNGQASSHYVGLQTGFNRRFSAGLQTQISYTFSKSMDITSGSIIGGGGFTNPTDMRSDYGLSTFDRRHNFRISWVYELPFRPKASMLAKMLDGWQLSGVGSYLSAAPFSPSAGFASTGTGAYTPRPNLVAGCDLYPANQGLGNWFNTSCFTPPPIGEFGNAGRNILIGPNFWYMDSALAKETRVSSISENFKVQFRAEFFNVTNHPSFATPSGNLWAQGPNGTFTPNAAGNRITATTSTPRQIQFGLKVIF